MNNNQPYGYGGYHFPAYCVPQSNAD